MNPVKNNKYHDQILLLKKEYIKLIKNKLGINIHSHQTYELTKTIHEACEKFNCTPEEYLILLEKSSNQSPMLDFLIAGITVGETYFFRDKQQMNLLESEVLPALINDKRKQNNLSLRIWSAGCASGEEIFTIGMLLIELIPDIKNWSIKLLATDINTTALQKGMKGIFSEWSMRSIPEYYKLKFFEKKGKEYLLSKEVSDFVNFDYLNLHDDSYPSIFNGTNSQDLILCRNVLIYFDTDSCLKLMRRLNSSLIIGGFLMLGASDPIHQSEIKTLFRHHKGVLFSRNAEIPQEIATKINLTKPLVKKSFVKPIITTTTKKKSSIHLEKTSHSLSNNEKAIALANNGHLEESLKLCEKGFKEEPTNKLNYFTYALTLMELNREKEAEISLRKTLFLDRQFVLGYFQLGLLLLRKKQYGAGMKYLTNALKIAETNNPKEPVVGSPGICYQKLVEILRNEIKLYSMLEVPHANQ